MSQENIFMHQVHDDAGAWSRAANRKKDRQAKREEREGQLERATSWKYFNEFMCLSNYGDKCLCINWQLAGWRSLSSLLSPTLFIPPRPSSLPLAEFMCWQAQATSQQQASKKKKMWPRHKQIRRLWLGFTQQQSNSKSRFTPHKVGIISFH